MYLSLQFSISITYIINSYCFYCNNHSIFCRIDIKGIKGLIAQIAFEQNFRRL